MYIKLKSEAINDKTGTFYLCLNGTYGLSLLVVLGRDSMNYSVSYYVDSVKYYKDNEIIYVDDISLKRALKFNFFESTVLDQDLVAIYGLIKGQHIFPIPDNISTRRISKKDLQAWYLKSKLINPLPDIKF